MIKFSPDGRQLAVASASQGSVVLWDIPKKRILNIFDYADFFCFSECGTLLATATSSENTITLRHGYENWEPLTIVFEQEAPITCLDFYTTDLLLVGSANGDISLLNVKSQTVLCNSRVHKGPVRFATRNIAMEIVSVGTDRRIVRSNIIYPEYAKPYLERIGRRIRVEREMTHYIGRGRDSLILSGIHGRVEYRFSDMQRKKADILAMGRWRSPPVIISADPELSRFPEYFKITAFGVSSHSDKEQVYAGFCDGGIGIGSLRLRRTIFSRLKAERIAFQQFAAHPDEAITAISGSAKTNILASSATDGQVKLWDLTTLEPIGILR